MVHNFYSISQKNEELYDVSWYDSMSLHTNCGWNIVIHLIKLIYILKWLTTICFRQTLGLESRQ